jgi:hypothetical protein
LRSLHFADADGLRHYSRLCLGSSATHSHNRQGCCTRKAEALERFQHFKKTDHLQNAGILKNRQLLSQRFFSSEDQSSEKKNEQTDRLTIRTEIMHVSIRVVDADGLNHLLLTESVDRYVGGNNPGIS